MGNPQMLAAVQLWVACDETISGLEMYGDRTIY